MYNVLLFYFQTVNKVLLAYADIVKRDFEKYTHRQKIVRFCLNLLLRLKYLYHTL